MPRGRPSRAKRVAKGSRKYAMVAASTKGVRIPWNIQRQKSSAIPKPRNSPQRCPRVAVRGAEGGVLAGRVVTGGR